MRIRFATVRDVPEMLPVINAAFALEAFFEGPRTDQKTLEAMLDKGQFLITENEGGHILGAVYLEKQDKRGYFGMLAVDPQFQGKGLGGALIDAAENYFRLQGCVGVDIHVLSLRPELLPLYRKMGYTETTTEAFTPERPLKAGLECYAILMSKTL